MQTLVQQVWTGALHFSQELLCCCWSPNWPLNNRPPQHVSAVPFPFASLLECF